MSRTIAALQLDGPGRIAGQNRIRLLGLFFAAAFAMISGQLVLINVLKPIEETNSELAAHLARIPPA